MSEEPEGSAGAPGDADEELRALARLLRDPERPGRAPAAGRPGAATPPARADAGGAPAAPRFELLAKLAGGPRSRLFRARDRENQGREILLEILDPELFEELDLAARAERARLFLELLRRIRSPLVLRPHDAGVDDEGAPFLVWGELEGESLKELVERAGALAPARALEIARQVLQGLEALHAQGLRHGELVPENVGLAPRVPWTRANPFGVGVRLRESGVAGLAGAPGSAAEDCLAAARLLAEALTGNRIAPDASDWAGSAASPSLQALAPRTRALLDAALARDPAARFQDARTFRAALERSPDARGRPALSARSARWLALAFGALWVATLVPLVVRGVRAADRPADDGAPGASAPAAPDAAAELERKDAELASLRATLDAARDELAGAQVERDALDRQLADEAAERGRSGEASSAERDALARDLAAKDAELGTLRTTLDAARTDLGRAEAERDALAQELAAEVAARASLAPVAAAGAAPPGAEDPGRAAARTRWEALLAEHDPPATSVLDQLRATPGARIEDFLERYARALAGTAPEGRLDLGLLARFRELGPWSDWLSAEPGLAANQDAQAILGFGAARAFYAGDALLPLPASILDAPHDGGWREELALRARLLGAGGARSAWPGPSGARALFYARPAQGEPSWRWESVRADPEPPADASESWLVEQRFHDASGRALSTRSLRLVRRGARFVEEDLDAGGARLAPRDVVDLARPGAASAVLTFVPAQVPLPPSGLGVPPRELLLFRAALARSERRALVLRDGPASLWLSSEFGLLRLEHGTRATNELAYAERQP